MSHAEQWRPIPGYEDTYEISDHGRVRSHHIWRGKREKGGRILVGGINRGGHRIVMLSLHAKTKTLAVSRIVAEAFLGPRPQGYFIEHINDDRADDRRSNLRYTRLSKIIKKRGFAQPAYRNALTQEDYDRISELHAQGLNQCAIAREVGCHNSLVSRIVRGIATTPRRKSEAHKQERQRRWSRAYRSDPEYRRKHREANARHRAKKRRKRDLEELRNVNAKIDKKAQS